MLTSESRQRDFPSLAGRVYLNTAAEGIPPRAVAEALNQYIEDKALGMDGRPLHERQWQQLRARAGEALGLSAEEIGICSCASEAFNLAAWALRLKDGDEVVINDLDFPAGATPWLQPSSPATVRVWRARDGALRLDDLQPLLGPRTRLVTTSLVSFYNGYQLPVRVLAGVIGKHSPALLAVDVTQALGRIPLDLADADLIVSSTHKWILGSHGGGIVGVPEGRADRWTVPAGGWFQLENAFDADRFERVVTRPGARSFSVGMPNYPAVYAVNAGLGYVQSVGVRAIDEHARPLVRACFDAIRKLRVEMLTPDEPDALAGIVAFRHADAERIHRRLREQNIHIMAHAGRLRVAIHGYNTLADIETFLKTLTEAIRNG